MNGCVLHATRRRRVLVAKGILALFYELQNLVIEYAIHVNKNQVGFQNKTIDIYFNALNTKEKIPFTYIFNIFSVHFPSFCSIFTTMVQTRAQARKAAEEANKTLQIAKDVREQKTPIPPLKSKPQAVNFAVASTKKRVQAPLSVFDPPSPSQSSKRVVIPKSNSSSNNSSLHSTVAQPILAPDFFSEVPKIEATAKERNDLHENFHSEVCTNASTVDPKISKETPQHSKEHISDQPCASAHNSSTKSQNLTKPVCARCKKEKTPKEWCLVCHKRFLCASCQNLDKVPFCYSCYKMICHSCVKLGHCRYEPVDINKQEPYCFRCWALDHEDEQQAKNV